MPVKALLCLLDKNQDGVFEEAALRNTGFATGALSWREVESQPGGWMQLLPLLEDEDIKLCLFSGFSDEYGYEFIYQLTMLTLALRRPKLPLMAFVLDNGGVAPDFPPIMQHIMFLNRQSAFAPKLMAAAFKRNVELLKPFHIAAHVDSLIGAWLEIGPDDSSDNWPGFMAGVLDGGISAFAVGPRGVIPKKAKLIYPVFGIKGNWNEYSFTACAAKNTLDVHTSCYIQIEDAMKGLLVGAYPDEASAMEARIIAFC
ncbi:MAG: hypothetical protein LBJ14_08880 [Desulfarculales bacterium]|nr:hypothetical protein [Desulfarculales bacterium]